MHYISQDGPLVIQVKGTIRLPTDVTHNGADTYGMHLVRSDKTIIGIGEDATIEAGGFGIGIYPWDNNILSTPPDATKNVIIRNLNFDQKDGVYGETDGVNIFMWTHHVWVDHCTFRNAVDGSVDIKRGASYVTVSNNLFIEAPQACMLGRHEGAEIPYEDTDYHLVTYHHNWYRDCDERMPWVYWGKAHVFNNYWSNVQGHALTVGNESQIYSENNYLDGGAFVTVQSEDGALLDQGSLGSESHNPAGVEWNPRSFYDYTLDPTDEVKEKVMANAGAGKLPL